MDGARRRRLADRVDPMKERGTLVVSLALLAGLATGSYWFAERARLSDTQTRTIGHEIDYTAGNITLTRMDETGRGEYTIDADRLVHYADDDTGEFTQPRMVGARADRPQMRVRADRGTTTADGEEIRLHDNVVFNRAAWKGAAPIVAKGPYMLLNPELETLTTDRSVDIVQGGSRVTANGMKYDNAVRHLTLDGGEKGGRIRHVIEPRAARSTRSEVQ